MVSLRTGLRMYSRCFLVTTCLSSESELILKIFFILCICDDGKDIKDTNEHQRHQSPGFSSLLKVKLRPWEARQLELHWV